MLYNEFIDGTQCKDNPHNYEVYKRLEIIYMNDDTVSKADIYEYGKKLVDNSPSEKEVAFRESIKSEIESHKKDLQDYKDKETTYKEYLEYDRTDKFWKDQLKWVREKIRREKAEISKLKWVLGL